MLARELQLGLELLEPIEELFLPWRGLGLLRFEALELYLRGSKLGLAHLRLASECLDVQPQHTHALLDDVLRVLLPSLKVRQHAATDKSA